MSLSPGAGPERLLTKKGVTVLFRCLLALSWRASTVGSRYHILALGITWRHCKVPTEFMRRNLHTATRSVLSDGASKIVQKCLQSIPALQECLCIFFFLFFQSLSYAQAYW